MQDERDHEAKGRWETAQIDPRESEEAGWATHEPPRRRGGIFRFLLIILLLGVVVASAGAYYVFEQFKAPGPLVEEHIITVPRGAGVSAIAERLEAEGVVSSALLFKAAAKVQGVESGLQANDYLIPAGASIVEVVALLSSGQGIDYKVTITPGLTVLEAVAIVQENAVLTGAVEQVPAEGMIAPDTYFVQRGESRQAVVDRMVAAQEQIIAEAWAARDEIYKGKPLPLASAEEMLILASIIEKETAVASERRMVSSVFVNRLLINMRLQTDPTVIYGITQGKGPLGRPISKRDLRTETAHNTYVIFGLPPTPIALPSKASIFAAVQPEATEYFYFVADGTGGHAFAQTLDEHNANVRKWRQIERERRENSGG